MINNLRPCYISITRDKKRIKALFHCWHFTNSIVTCNTYCAGIVELENGRIVEVLPENITFADCVFQDYCWDETRCAEPFPNDKSPDLKYDPYKYARKCGDILSQKRVQNDR